MRVNVPVQTTAIAKNSKITLDITQRMYHNNNQAPTPTRIGTGAQKNRRVEGKRTFYEGYRQPNNETPVCGRDDTGSRQGQVSNPPVPTRSATVPARS